MVNSDAYQACSRCMVLVASAFITVGLYSQAIKLWKTRGVKDFSMILVVSLFLNEVAWLNYGVSLHEWPMEGIGAANMPAAVMILIGYFLYRNLTDQERVTEGDEDNGEEAASR